MIITKKQPYTKEEIEKLAERFETYIKTVIDLKEKGSKQENLWGGGIDLKNLIIDYNSMINIRPKENNSNEILDLKKRDEFDKLMKYFFKDLFNG